MEMDLIYEILVNVVVLGRAYVLALRINDARVIYLPLEGVDTSCCQQYIFQN